jgi:hypothetical protein
MARNRTSGATSKQTTHDCRNAMPCQRSPIPSTYVIWRAWAKAEFWFSSCSLRSTSGRKDVVAPKPQLLSGASCFKWSEHRAYMRVPVSRGGSILVCGSQAQKEWRLDGSGNHRRSCAVAAVCPLTPTRLFFDGIRYWNCLQILFCQTIYSVTDTVKKLGC